MVAPAGFESQESACHLSVPLYHHRLRRCSGFHCLVPGTSSKQLKDEPDARFVGYGSMLTEGFLPPW